MGLCDLTATLKVAGTRVEGQSGGTIIDELALLSLSALGPW